MLRRPTDSQPAELGHQLSAAYAEFNMTPFGKPLVADPSNAEMVTLNSAQCLSLANKLIVLIDASNEAWRGNYLMKLLSAGDDPGLKNGFGLLGAEPAKDLIMSAAMVEDIAAYISLSPRPSLLEKVCPAPFERDILGSIQEDFYHRVH
ncbi:MAG: hypothetical protein AUK47_03590 [Deltaproteobacteria bacterium CG2_30_63_29]|nr:MAG: hypothetical protein AUK47_03590 [Deltaproteobacteria bacterium CG2_30_63_29]PIV98313.1 MAG: hypothetical protein COW42_15390 [Deltaproteobacteria bacterium CG17_big_fil_post_rev_8_21_14_2_50_63_7]